MAAGHKFGIPVRGTQSHSWVMSFDTEEEAFSNYAKHLPDSMSVFLVDIYSTIEGIKKAIKVAKTMDHRTFTGIRIDSGDLAWLSKQARKMLDEAGFKTAKIIVSNVVDEFIIESVNKEGGKVDCWGVGPSLLQVEIMLQ